MVGSLECPHSLQVVITMSLKCREVLDQLERQQNQWLVFCTEGPGRSCWACKDTVLPQAAELSIHPIITRTHL